MNIHEFSLNYTWATNSFAYHATLLKGVKLLIAMRKVGWIKRGVWYDPTVYTEMEVRAISRGANFGART